MRSVVNPGGLTQNSLAAHKTGFTEGKHGRSDDELLTHDWVLHTSYGSTALRPHRVHLVDSYLLLGCPAVLLEY
jgi:hypothetical protein